MDNSDTGDLTWGHLEDTEVYGQKTTAEDYIQIDQETVFKQYPVDREASHCLIYARSNTKVFNVYRCRAVVLLQMRFDGYIGFPGGLVDPGEDKLTCLNRELVEEINLDLSKHKITPEDYIVSHYNPKTRILLHFYAMEISLEELEEIEQRTHQAQDYGTEVLGTIRMPLYTMGDGVRGLPVFLQHQFIGNSKTQLLYTLEKRDIMTKNEIERVLGTS